MLFWFLIAGTVAIMVEVSWHSANRQPGKHQR